METFEAIEKRRSIRNFNELAVEWEKIGNILKAAQLAPSSGNTQDCKFVVVTDKVKRAAIANAALKQHWIAKAPVLIIVFSDSKQTQRFYGLRGEKLYTIQNSAAAIENILIAATDQSLASCWVGAFDENMINTILGAPNSVRPQAIIPIGYSDDKPEMPQKYQLVDVVYINKWGGKIVNIDLVFDEFSNVVQKKLNEVKEAIVDKGPTFGQGFVKKSKDKVNLIRHKIKERIGSFQAKDSKEPEKSFDEKQNPDDNHNN